MSRSRKRGVISEITTTSEIKTVPMAAEHKWLADEEERLLNAVRNYDPDTNLRNTANMYIEIDAHSVMPRYVKPLGVRCSAADINHMQRTDYTEMCERQAALDKDGVRHRPGCFDFATGQLCPETAESTETDSDDWSPSSPVEDVFDNDDEDADVLSPARVQPHCYWGVMMSHTKSVVRYEFEKDYSKYDTDEESTAPTIYAADEAQTSAEALGKTRKRPRVIRVPYHSSEAKIMLSFYYHSKKVHEDPLLVFKCPLRVPLLQVERIASDMLRQTITLNDVRIMVYMRTHQLRPYAMVEKITAEFTTTALINAIQRHGVQLGDLPPSMPLVQEEDDD